MDEKAVINENWKAIEENLLKLLHIAQLRYDEYQFFNMHNELELLIAAINTVRKVAGMKSEIHRSNG